MNHKRQAALIGGILLTSGLTFASSQYYLPSGSAVTSGQSINPRLGSSAQFNPAAIYYSTGRTRISLISLGVGTEFDGGKELLQANDRVSLQAEITADALADAENNPSTALQSVQDLQARLNSELLLVSDVLYAQPSAYISLPFLPLDIRSERFGAFSLGISSYSAAKVQLLHNNLNLNIDANTLNDAEGDIDPLDYLETASSLYAKSGQLFNLSLGYARPVYQLEAWNAEVMVGGRATLVAHSLQKNLYPIKDLVRELTEENGDAELVINKIEADLLAERQEFSYNLALDTGVILAFDRQHLGLTLRNINRPKYQFNVIGGDCLEKATDLATSECLHAELFASYGKINLKETHVANPVATLDAGWQLLNNQVAFTGALDLWQYNDLFGRPRQQLSLAVLLQPQQWWFPDTRLGVQRNFASDDINQYGLGLGLFNVLQLDLGVRVKWADLFADDEATQAGALRGFNASAGLALNF